MLSGLGGVLEARPLSVFQGRRSSEAIQAILPLHFPAAKTTVDPTYGKGVFWKGINIAVTGGDLEGSRSKDWVGDCRALPFRDNSFDIGVLDLPFMHDIKAHSGTNLWDDFRGIGSWEKLVSLSCLGAEELGRVCRQGFIIKLKDGIESGQYRPIVSLFISRFKAPYDVLVLVPQVTLATDPKWKTVQHFRRQESYFLVYKT